MSIANHRPYADLDQVLGIVGSLVATAGRVKLPVAQYVGLLAIARKLEKEGFGRYVPDEPPVIFTPADGVGIDTATLEAMVRRELVTCRRGVISVQKAGLNAIPWVYTPLSVFALYCCHRLAELRLDVRDRHNWIGNETRDWLVVRKKLPVDRPTLVPLSGDRDRHADLVLDIVKMVESMLSAAAQRAAPPKGDGIPRQYIGDRRGPSASGREAWYDTSPND